MRAQAVDSVDRRFAAIAAIRRSTRCARLDPGVLRDPETAAIVQTAVATGAWQDHVKQNMAAPRRGRSLPQRADANVIVIEATANRDILVEQLDELSNFCDAARE